MSFVEGRCPNCAAKLDARGGKYYCGYCDGNWSEESLKLAYEKLNRQIHSADKKEKEETKALICPFCGGNFTVSDLMDEDEFVTCTKCGKVYLTADICPKVAKNKITAKGDDKEAEKLKSEREKIEKERHKIEQERLRLEKERNIKEAHERLDAIIGNQNIDNQATSNQVVSSHKFYQKPRQSTKSYNAPSTTESVKYCNKWVTLFLCYFLGIFGVHKFYEGNKKWGVIFLCTFGFFGYGWVFDLIRCCFRILFSPRYYPKRIN